MNEAVKAILLTMLNKKHIGRKHTPEEKIVKSRIKWLDSSEKKEFKKEYKQLVNETIIIRLKKRTKKESDWHISLNPRKLKALYEKLR